MLILTLLKFELCISTFQTVSAILCLCISLSLSCSLCHIHFVFYMHTLSSSLKHTLSVFPSVHIISPPSLSLCHLHSLFHMQSIFFSQAHSLTFSISYTRFPTRFFSLSLLFRFPLSFPPSLSLSHPHTHSYYCFFCGYFFRVIFIHPCMSGISYSNNCNVLINYFCLYKNRKVIYLQTIIWVWATYNNP